MRGVTGKFGTVNLEAASRPVWFAAPGLLKIRVLFPFTDTLGGLLCFVYLDKPVAGHFLCDFIAWF